MVVFLGVFLYHAYMSQSKATNITWHGGEVDQAAREQLLHQKGVILWFTGLSGSGKSTVAVALEAALYQRGQLSYRLDGDNIRHGLNSDLGFSPADRTENIRRIGEVAKLMLDSGVIVLSSFVSPYAQDRDLVRALVQPGQFIEVFVDCPIDVCEQRDPKGLYKKARAGEIPEFTGVSAPYEAPANPEVHVNSADTALDQIVEKLMNYLVDRGIIPVAA